MKKADIQVTIKYVDGEIESFQAYDVDICEGYAEFSIDEKGLEKKIVSLYNIKNYQLKELEE